MSIFLTIPDQFFLYLSQLFVCIKLFFRNKQEQKTMVTIPNKARKNQYKIHCSILENESDSDSEDPFNLLGPAKKVKKTT